MSREFKTPDYEATLNSTITLREALPLNHLARFVVDVITQLDLSAIYARYAPVGGSPIAPEILLGLLFYGHATGVFSSRKIERATSENIPFRYVAIDIQIMFWTARPSRFPKTSKVLTRLVQNLT